MGRELRMVPATWVHPMENGHQKPLYDGLGYREKAARWIQDFIAWDNGTHPDLLKHPEAKNDHRYFWEWEGMPPDIEDYMLVDVPESERTHFMLYETTTEGTPCKNCPAFATLDELCAWAATHATTFASFTATAEDWKRMLSEDFVRHEERQPNGITLAFM